jgi:hypothetical protein
MRSEVVIFAATLAMARLSVSAEGLVAQGRTLPRWKRLSQKSYRHRAGGGRAGGIGPAHQYEVNDKPGCRSRPGSRPIFGRRFQLCRQERQ